MWHRVLIAEGGAAGGGATGGVSGLPEVQAAHMQLATNASNEAVW